VFNVFQMFEKQCTYYLAGSNVHVDAYLYQKQGLK